MVPPEPSDKSLALNRKDLGAALALLAVAVIVLWPMLGAAAGKAPGLPGHDGRTQWYPWRAFSAEWMKQGVLPLWNPYVLCGTPFAGNMQSALFYPPNVVFLIMPVYAAARASIVFHIGLSLFFTYLLARYVGCKRSGAMVAAMAFGLGAAQVLRVPAGHWGVSCAIPWLPLILLCLEALLRKPAALTVSIGALAVAMQVLSGVPQYAFITGVASGVFVLLRGFGDGLSWRRRLRRWGAVVAVFILGAVIAGMQLVPALEAARSGARVLPMRTAWIEQFSLAPEALLTLFVPGFFGGVEGVPWWGRYFFWEMTAYTGVVVLALAVGGALSSKRRRLGACLGVLAALMLLLALGRHTPLLRCLAAIMPMRGMFRGAAKFLLPFQLALAVLAGLGVTALLEGGDRERRRAVVFSVGVLVLAALIVFMGAQDDTLAAVRNRVWRSGECLNPAIRSLPPGVIRGPVVRGGLVTLGLLTALAGGLFFLSGSRKRWLAVLVCVLAAADAIHFGRLFVSGERNFNATGSSWPATAAGLLKSAGARSRTLVLRNPNMNDGMLVGVPTAEGIEPNPPVRFHQLFRRAQGLPDDLAPSMYQMKRWQPLADCLAVGHVVVPTKVAVDVPDSQVLWRGKTAKILKAPDNVGRAFVVYEAHCVASPSDALKATLATPLRNRVVLEGTGLPEGVHGARRRDRGAVRIVQAGPNAVLVGATAEADGWLVLLDNYYPGWRAEVDGRPVTIYPANFSFRAVPLTKGKHQVRFTYVPASLRWGFGLSIVGIALCAVLLLGGLRRGGVEPVSGDSARSRE